MVTRTDMYGEMEEMNHRQLRQLINKQQKGYTKVIGSYNAHTRKYEGTVLEIEVTGAYDPHTDTFEVYEE